jgi:DNA-binding transcriptional LysR family regulator
MEDHRLKCFCLVVEQKSFSKAAEMKFITQSAMSHLIKGLEEELGVKLLNRRGRTVSTTPAGRLLYDHARHILEKYRGMEDDLRSAVTSVRGPLSVGATETAAALLPQAFYGFLKTFPEARISVTVSPVEAILEDVVRGRLDFGIVEGRPRDARLQAEQLAEDEVVLISSEGDELAKLKQPTISDLAKRPLILPDRGSPLREEIEQIFAAAKIPLTDCEVVMTARSPALVIPMVQSGIGAAFVSKWAAFGAIRDGSVVVVPLPIKRLRRSFCLVAPKEERPSFTARTFREFILAFRFFSPF